MAGFLLLADHA
ncbi:hypothetical protein LINGRAHAP2_LOCUS27889 [Linum grandiflorum]